MREERGRWYWLAVILTRSTALSSERVDRLLAVLHGAECQTGKCLLMVIPGRSRCTQMLEVSLTYLDK